MNAFVGFFGLNRSLQWTADSIRSNILSVFAEQNVHATVCAHYNVVSEITNPRSWEFNVPYNTESARLLPVEVLWQETQNAEKLAKFINTASSCKDFFGDDYRSARNIVYQLHSLSRVGQMLDHLFTETTFEAFFFFRPDLLYLDKMPLEAAMDQVRNGTDLITPSWEQWYGYNDRFAFCSRRGASTYLTRLGRIPEFCEHVGHLQGEKLLRFCAEKDGLRCEFTPMRGHRVRATGHRYVDDCQMTQ